MSEYVCPDYDPNGSCVKREGGPLMLVCEHPSKPDLFGQRFDTCSECAAEMWLNAFVKVRSVGRVVARLPHWNGGIREDI